MKKLKIMKYKTSFRVIIISVVMALCLFSTTEEVNAQFDPMFTQYMNNEMFINPAYAGAKEALAFTLLHRQQWVGFPGRPITTTFSINAPLYQNKMGLGLAFLNEKIGVLNRNLIYLSYAYRLRTGARSFLSFGLMGGVHLQVNRLGDVTTTQPGDPSFIANTPLIGTPNFGLGMYFNTDKFYASFSIPRMLDDNITYNSAGKIIKGVSFKLRSWHYYLAAGRVFTISDNFKLKPHAMMKLAVNAPVEFDINLNALIIEKLWLGVGYRSKADISFMAGIQILPALLLSYSYDYQLTPIKKFSGGSHEIVLSYVFAYKGKKILSPRYF